MFNKIAVTVLLLCFSLSLKAIPPVVFRPDSILKILKINNPDTRERQLTYYIQTLFGSCAIDSLDFNKNQVDKLLLQYNVPNSPALEYLIDGISKGRVFQFNDAENSLTNAIELAYKSDDHFLLYSFFTYLGFIQTARGNTIDAVASFRLANKEAITLDDAYLEVLIDVNISDIYYRNNFYTQSLFYLNEAQTIIAKNNIKEQRLKNAINNNIAENYFRMRNTDSLKKYNTVLNNTKNGTFRLYSYKKRTDYYLSLLHHDYANAIKRIKELEKDTLYNFDNTDRQNLADAYFNTGQTDSAKKIINQLLTAPEQNNHPEIKFHLYDVLGQIALKENDYKSAADNFKLALQQSEDNINRLTQVGNISSEIKLDELHGTYFQREETYKRERTWLIFTVIVSVLTLAIAGMLYRNITQKRYYEKLLYTAKKEELSFINSHEVRKHLSNILGIVDIMKHSKNKDKEYLQAEEHLLSAAKDLDAAIKNISEKLDS